MGRKGSYQRFWAVIRKRLNNMGHDPAEWEEGFEEYCKRHELDPKDPHGEADVFFGHYLTPPLKGNRRSNAQGDGSRGIRAPSIGRGSLLNVVMYANAFPYALEARRAILGRDEPLSLAEAWEWLERTTTQPDPDKVEWIEVSLRFQLKAGTKKRLEGQHPEARRGNPIEWIKLLVDHTLSVNRAMDQLMPVAVYSDGGMGDQRLFLQTERTAPLAERAWFLAPFCQDDPGQAVWLILAGHWMPGLAVAQGGMQPRRVDNQPDPRFTAVWRRGFEHRTPAISFTHLAPEYGPKRLSAFYIRLREQEGLSSGGREMSYAAQALGLIAVEVMNLKKLYMGWDGFYPAVFERWQREAERFEVNPAEHFKTLSSVINALNRLEAAYSGLGGGSLFKRPKPMTKREIREQIARAHVNAKQALDAFKRGGKRISPVRQPDGNGSTSE